MNSNGNGSEMWDNGKYLPIFGNGHDLCCGFTGGKSYTKIGNSYIRDHNDLQFLDGKQGFTIAELEVFGF